MPPKKADEGEQKGAARFGRVKNNLKMGLLGLPNVGKSSLFNLLTEQSIAAENYPFCTIDPNESRCPVPDERYDFLCNMWNPPSKYPAYLHVTDIAGLVRGASEGAGLGNAFLSHVAAVDGLFHVVRAFDNDEVVHVDDSVDPVRDLETIQMELCKKDLDYLSRAEADAIKDVKKTPNMKLPLHFYSTFEKVKELLQANKPVRDAEWTAKEVELIMEKMPNLLTSKPMIYLVNLSAADFQRKKNKWLAKIHQWVQEHGGGPMIPISVQFEQKLWELRENPTALQAYLEETKCASALPKVIVTGYKELNLIYYFTAGETEVRCWTILKGTLAPQAAGVIHTDFERGFIKAEVVAFDDFKRLTTTKGMAEVKAAGRYRQEGKAYVVEDGDIIHFQFNVTAKKK
ncbi:hypothetical protein OEZ85_004551 [Tetradesmus obliquus]|uniref:Obg-like ATPase 1 n=1 Tax=Tetradesmus obliquus TaxID=3088 RepID=A0ABY8UNJ4_TETOB|nr:hypothetical protein OEZ85_004551 [Tetradesmus obliquus]